MHKYINKCRKIATKCFPFYFTVVLDKILNFPVIYNENFKSTLAPCTVLELLFRKLRTTNFPDFGSD